jgi:BirA family biotin operon repressor/biotin-[acetyl-CoA-carboxylase] ligase
MTETLNVKRLKLKSVDSAHKLALSLIENGKAEELAITAENQTNGIGRCERPWQSLKGNLLASVIKKVPKHREWGKLSLAVGVAVHEAISHYVSEDLYLHWPNDVYYKKSKISGILITVIDSWATISVGVNANSAPSVANAACLKDICGREIQTEEILNRILVGLRERFDNFEPSSFSFVKSYWLRYVNEIDRIVTIRNGLDSIVGIFRGIDDSGRLILERDGRNAFVSSGDMFLNTEGITVNYE